MTRPRFVLAVFSLLLSAGLALAADVTGKWTGQFSGPNGDMTITFNFKQDGTKLSGTVEGPAGELPLQDGKVEADKISFTVSFDAGGGEMKILHDGTIKGEDEITLNTKFEGGPGGEAPPPMTLKRVK